MFRTTFDIHDQKIVQRISETVELGVPYAELQPSETVEDRFGHFVKPFDLAKAPLFRAELVKITESSHVLFIDMHHLISDGYSMSVFMKELVGLYEAKYCRN